MNGPSIHTSPAQDARTATQLFAATEDFAPAPGASSQQALPLKLAASDGSLPHLTGEIRDLVRIRLREVAVLITIGWSLLVLLCLSGLDGLFNVAHLGT